MGFINKLFGVESKQNKLETLAVQFDAAKKEFLQIVVVGLSDADVRERQATAEIIREQVLPALALDDNPRSRALSEATLRKLMSELRPPRGENEMYDLDNAVFHYLRRQMLHQDQR